MSVSTPTKHGTASAHDGKQSTKQQPQVGFLSPSSLVWREKQLFNGIPRIDDEASVSIPASQHSAVQEALVPNIEEEFVDAHEFELPDKVSAYQATAWTSIQGFRANKSRVGVQLSYQTSLLWLVTKRKFFKVLSEQVISLQQMRFRSLIWLIKSSWSYGIFSTHVWQGHSKKVRNQTSETTDHTNFNKNSTDDDAPFCLVCWCAFGDEQAVVSCCHCFHYSACLKQLAAWSGGG